MLIKWWLSLVADQVNGIRSHTTCFTCVLKSHMLQNELTGYTTCETCAPRVTKWFHVWFFGKTSHVRATWGRQGSQNLHKPPIVFFSVQRILVWSCLIAKWESSDRNNCVSNKYVSQHRHKYQVHSVLRRNTKIAKWQLLIPYLLELLALTRTPLDFLYLVIFFFRLY